jgi:hypothetical protein
MSREVVDDPAGGNVTLLRQGRDWPAMPGAQMRGPLPGLDQARNPLHVSIKARTAGALSAVR